MAPPILPNLNTGQYANVPKPIREYLRQLDVWAKRIDGQAVKFGVPPPGGSYIQSPTILAGVIKNLPNASSKAGMTADFLNQYQDVTDANGTVTAEWGKLAAKGNSPAQFGFRANDASGNPFFDSQGLFAGVMGSLGVSAVFVNASGTSTSYTTLPSNVSISFTTTRTLNLLFFFFATAWVTGGVGQIRIRLNLVGQAQSGPLKFALSGATNGFGHLFATSIPAGSYTAQVEYQVDTGVTGFIDQSYVQGFQLGQ